MAKLVAFKIGSHFKTNLIEWLESEIKTHRHSNEDAVRDTYQALLDRINEGQFDPKPGDSSQLTIDG